LAFNSSEHTFDRFAKEIDGGDDHTGDTSGNQAVLNSGGTGFVLNKTRYKLTHDFTPRLQNVM